MVPPQEPEAVKVKVALVETPLVSKTPMAWGAPGEVTPLVASKVTTRLVVLALPKFLSRMLTATVSPGSIAPLGDPQSSVNSEKLSTSTLGVDAGVAL